jgi:hypothetical protein
MARASFFANPFSMEACVARTNLCSRSLSTGLFKKKLAPASNPADTAAGL